jgi:MoaA/NifB/PqqE/SkfB family radical SAM enzyme
MRITIYKKHNQYMSYDFNSKELDKILKICYDLNIKRKQISIVFNEQEQDDYERLSQTDIIKETGNEYASLVSEGT